MRKMFLFGVAIPLCVFIGVFLAGCQPPGTESCTDDCDYSGQKICVLGPINGSKTCGDYDNDTCLEWKVPAKLCPAGCEEGDCITLTCTDSDGGKDYYIKGELKDQTGESHFDYCDQGIVYEYWCDGQIDSLDYYTCPNGCSDGSCEYPPITGLKSDFFKNDEIANSIIDNISYPLRDSNLYSPDDNFSLNYNLTSFEYKLANAFRQLGYLGVFWRKIFGVDTESTAALHRFQERNNLPLTDYLDAETLLLIDKELYAIEQRDKADILNYPAFSAFSKRTPVNEPPIEHIAALYYKLAIALPSDIPVGPEGQQSDARMPLTIEELLHRLACPRYVNFGLMLSPDGERVLDCQETIEVHNAQGDFMFCPAVLYNGFIPVYTDTDCINPPTERLRRIFSMSNYDFMYLIIHEYGHEVGEPIIEIDGFNRSINNHFRKISFTDYPSDISWLRQDNYDEFIDSYARDGVKTETIPPAWNAPHEDFAESFTFYLLQGKIFRMRAKENAYLQQKYDFLKNYVFMGKEYDTGDLESYGSLLAKWRGARGADFLYDMDIFKGATSRLTIWHGDYPIYSRPISPPPAPENVTVSASGRTVTFLWPAVPGAASYIVSEYPDGNYCCGFDIINDLNIILVTTTGLDYIVRQRNYTYYFFDVYAKNAYGVSPPTRTNNVNIFIPTITVTSPNGGESWRGSTHTITWNSTGTMSGVTIKFKGGNTAFFQDIATATPNDGSYDWTIPSTLTESSDYIIKLIDADDQSIYDSSDGYFNIIPPTIPTITVTSPNGGESWAKGIPHTIRWNSTNVTAVSILLFKGDSVCNIVTGNTSSDGSYDWTIPAYEGGSNYKIRIAKDGDFTIVDFSDHFFSIY